MMSDRQQVKKRPATATTHLNIEIVSRVMHEHDTADDPDLFGWRIHQPADDPTHVLVSCDVPAEWARAMPGSATRQAIARHLTRYAASLRDAGLGVAAWPAGSALRWEEMPRILIVAANQAAADEIAPGIRAHLTELNPDAVPAARPAQSGVVR